MARQRLNLTRDQLASFLNDFEQIKQFELLFSTVDTIDSLTLDEINISAGTANASANEALAQISSLSDQTALTSFAPVIENNNSVVSDYIDYRTTAPLPSPKIGRTFWDGGQTLNIQQTLNVAGKINEDNFYYIKADSTIAKGQLIMFTGAVGSSGVLRGAPAAGLGINDGIRLMGVAAENIATNGFGLVQWSGVLRGFNTTGSPYGETWADGDILYYNPAYAGGLTKVEPTAPNVRAVIAAVVNAGSGGSGSVAVRLSVGSVLGGTDSNVYINGLTAGDLLQYDGVDQRWENHAPSTVTVGTATNLAGGAANRIAYQTGAGATGFIAAPTIANTFLEWSGSAFQWSLNPAGTVTSVSGTGTVNGITLTGTVTSSGSLTLGGTLSGVSLTTQVTGTLPIANGGTGSTSTTYCNLTTNVTGTLPVGNGGTGATTFTANALLKGNTTSAISASNVSDDGSTVSIGSSIGFSIARTTVTAPAAADGNVFSGTYTPTAFNTTNIAASTPRSAQYLRVGNTVTVSGQIDIDPTATGFALLGLSIPIASAITSAVQLSGVFNCPDADGGGVYGDATNDRATFQFTASSAANLTYYYTFTYRVL